MKRRRQPKGEGGGGGEEKNKLISVWRQHGGTWQELSVSLCRWYLRLNAGTHTILTISLSLSLSSFSPFVRQLLPRR